MRHARKVNKSKRNDWVMTIILVCVFAAGVGILLYPTVSNWWNERVSTRAIAAYGDAMADLSAEDYTVYFEKADAYNKELARIGSARAIAAPELVDEDYRNLLDITGTGVMGYVTIDKIDVQLPIYHGTDAQVLRTAAGHLEGTSLPVGGAGTHSVISAHRGLPSAKLFTDLDQLETGDHFTITVLNEVLTYEIDQITIVLPDEIEALYIEEDEDYCTLMTCTPYGVNSHRLLVRGIRIQTSDAAAGIKADALEVDIVVAAGMIAVPLLLLLFTWLLMGTDRRKK